MGARVVHLTASSPIRQRDRSIEASEALSEQIGHRIARASLDGVVQMGSDFTLPSGVRYVTFEDATVAQALIVLDLPAAVGEAWRRRQHRAYEGATACCLASNWAAQSVRDDYGVANEKIHVVGFGANLELELNPCRRIHDPTFLFVGRDWERKNGPAVLRAFAEVRRRIPAATLDLVGKHPENVGVPGVRGHGPLDHTNPDDRGVMSCLFSRATCLVLPSRFEPFGIAYVEAGAAGVPSIGTAVGGAREAIGEGGLVVDPWDQHALREAMLALSEPSRARRLGRAARRNAVGYTWTRVAARVLGALGFA